jgi:pyridoxine kinase
LVTSFRDPKQKNKIGLLASDGADVYSICTPELPISIGMAGSGDITTSMFLARYLETKDLKKALELCTSSIFSLIEKSWHFHNGNAWNPALMELRLVHEQKEIVSPNRIFEAKLEIRN